MAHRRTAVSTDVSASSISPKFHLGCEGGCAIDDTPRNFPGWSQTDVTARRKTRQMPGDQIWRKPDMGESKTDN